MSSINKNAEMYKTKVLFNKATNMLRKLQIVDYCKHILIWYTYTLAFGFPLGYFA